MKRARKEEDDDNNNTSAVADDEEWALPLEVLADSIAAHASFDTLLTLASTCTSLADVHYRQARELPAWSICGVPTKDVLLRFRWLTSLDIRHLDNIDDGSVREVFANLTTLRKLRASGTDLIHDRLLVTLTHLTSLELRHVRNISGASVRRLTNLVSLAVDCPRVRGDAITPLTRLVKLDTHYGVFDDNLGALPRLDTLLVHAGMHLGSELMTDSLTIVPSALGQQTSLRCLDIHLPIPGVLATNAALAPLVNLERLVLCAVRRYDMIYTDVTLRIDDALRGMTRLRSLRIAGFRAIVDQGETFASLAPTLDTLNLRSIPVNYEAVASLTRLEKLVLRNCSCAQPVDIPSVFAILSALRVLDIGPDAVGMDDTVLAALTSLTSLTIDGNEGCVTNAGVLQLTNLTTLNCYNNKSVTPWTFRGRLPLLQHVDCVPCPFQHKRSMWWMF